MKVSEVLERAAQMIESIGWCQSAMAVTAMGEAANLFDPGVKGICIDGALRISAKDNVSGDAEESCFHVYERCLDYIETEIDGAVWGWNDAPGRKQAEVIVALLRAAARATADEFIGSQDSSDRLRAPSLRVSRLRSPLGLRSIPYEQGPRCGGVSRVGGVESFSSRARRRSPFCVPPPMTVTASLEDVTESSPGADHVASSGIPQDVT